MNREKIIIRTSIIGIIGNAILVVFKMMVGLLSNSIAIILDAVNNLSDALSSIITIIGTKLATKKPDKDHPYGHGRIEYITSAIISIIVMFAGIVSFKESVAKVLRPEPVNYTMISVVVVVAAIVVKFFLGRYVKGVGEKIDSGSLIASGTDASFDAILSFATLVCIIINLTLHFNIEGIVGVIISCFIIKAGSEMLLDSIQSIIGTRAQVETTLKLRKLVKSIPGVLGAYDIVLHNYGPNMMIGSVHVEVSDETTSRQIHALSRKITEKVFDEMGIVITVGIYASNNTDETTIKVRHVLSEIIKDYQLIKSFHAFYLDEKVCTFDLVFDFGGEIEPIVEKVKERMKEAFPQYDYQILVDMFYSD